MKAKLWMEWRGEAINKMEICLHLNFPNDFRFKAIWSIPLSAENKHMWKNKNLKIQKSKNQKSKFQKSKNQKSKFQKSKNQKSKNTKKFPYMEILNKEIHVTQISLNGNFGLHDSYTSFPKWK